MLIQQQFDEMNAIKESLKNPKEITKAIDNLVAENNDLKKDMGKQKELAKSAQVWIDRHGRPEESYRFDVVGVLMQGDRVRVRHVEDAFKLARSG